jgi:hypothetical protein
VILSANLDDVTRTGLRLGRDSLFGGSDRIFNGRGGGFEVAGTGNDVVWPSTGTRASTAAPAATRSMRTALSARAAARLSSWPPTTDRAGDVGELFEVVDDLHAARPASSAPASRTCALTSGAGYAAGVDS